MKKANKQEMELRAAFAADLLAQGHSSSCVIDPSDRRIFIVWRQTRRVT